MRGGRSERRGLALEPRLPLASPSPPSPGPAQPGRNPTQLCPRPSPTRLSPSPRLHPEQAHLRQGLVSHPASLEPLPGTKPTESAGGPWCPGPAHARRCKLRRPTAAPHSTEHPAPKVKVSEAWVQNPGPEILLLGEARTIRQLLVSSQRDASLCRRARRAPCSGHSEMDTVARGSWEEARGSSEDTG